ncbi:MAG: 4Fe-4S binding protein, partial [Oscillibacter sp.]|nr:4Fe-4S binding protein [Oscillibacter sp.]
GALAVPVVTFGNRAFDNALAELCALLSGNGFRNVSAAAFVCRHAFTDKLGQGRPDRNDRRSMEAFAEQTAEKVRDLDPDGPIPPPHVPGNPEAPYYIPRGTDGEPAGFLKAKPRTDLSRCTRCGACARRCPVDAIDKTEPWNVPGVCIKCQACVRCCTRRAKYFDDPAFLSHVAMIEGAYAEPKGNRIFV